MSASSSRRALAVFACLMVGPVLAAQTSASGGSAPQPPPAAHRPKIGLALSGGGARGAAHIGVLKALEAMHVPIDYIAGTSMGSIIGGLYATGATPEQLQDTIGTTDWNEVFSDRPPRKNLPFRQKEDDRRYVEGVNMGLDSKGLHVKRGLIDGHKLVVLLENKTLRASGISDFDKLPIPFRCVATDIVTGDKVVLSKGSLPLAIRASMSLPAVFTPCDLEGRLLVDGGLVDNLPVDVVRAMGADVVIAVDIGTPPLNREQITSPLAVYSQVLNILMQKTIDQQAAKADVLIRPDLGRFSNMDFERALTLIPVGERAVEADAAVLSRYAVSPQEYAAWQARLHSLPPPPKTLDFVEFQGTDPLDETRLRHKLQTKPGEPLDLQKVQKDLTLIYNTGDYASVQYELVKRGGETGVVLTAKANPVGPNYMRFGLSLDTNFRYNSNWAVLAGLRFTRLNPLGAEWKTDVEVGLDRRLSSELYQPLDRADHWFVAPVVTYYNLLQYTYLVPGESPDANYRVMQGMAGVDLGINFGLSTQLRIGPRWGKARFQKAVGVALFPSLSVSSGGFAGTLTVDTLDSADIPTRGTYFSLAAFDSEEGMGAAEAYRKAELKYKGYYTLGRGTYFGWLSAGTSLGSKTPIYDWFQLGGPRSFGGYSAGQLYGRYYGAARLGFQYQFANLPALIGQGAYAAVWGDVGNVWFQTRDIGWSGIRYSGTLAVGSSTKLGPVLFGFSFATENNQQVFILLGKRW